ncbi:phosphomevalonate kinase [Arthroderma uncinatum]|uniref:phosphomevalonate kinase n=1 Tax=Arthroderma uncinatum TaxID=74035 RepID=UPI00144ACC7F|nr:phosphomevalonate kinase [Arthroderma uncinatum]KAF3483065.1 phosphomevalonate kinase [Arthroderma uncinatum]
MRSRPQATDPSPSHSDAADSSSRHLELARNAVVARNAVSMRVARAARDMAQRQPPTETAVSAPGKVLLAGGYLVLDRDYTGTVCALDARIHVVVQQQNIERRTADTQTQADTVQLEGEAAEKSDVAQEEDTVTVRSPQFVDAVWEYKIRRSDNGGGVKAVQTGDGPRNPFVETSLNYALTYASYVSASQNIGSLAITILADDDYYSETTASSAPQGGPAGFKKFGVRLQDAHKTGLGSSAALVTALVSALVVHRTVPPEKLAQNRQKLHNLAQAAHCAAQGKIGSGFDVAAAVYGSCYYRRFSPSVLAELGEPGSPKFEDRLFSIVEDLNTSAPWDTECNDVGFELPGGMQMVLCDVDCGSQTPGMVKKLLRWREENREEADAIWSSLQLNNEKIRLELKKLTLGPGTGNFNEVRSLLLKSRMWIKTMTKKSGVPVEPLVQTELLDALGKLDGVIGGVVPGAGGYDAIALLIEDDPDIIDAIRAYLEDWHSTVEDDFGGKIERVRLLGVGYGSEGILNELPVRYSEWI